FVGKLVVKAPTTPSRGTLAPIEYPDPQSRRAMKQNRLSIPSVKSLMLFLAFISAFNVEGKCQHSDSPSNSKNADMNGLDWSRIPDWAVAAFTLVLAGVSFLQWRAMVAAT